MFSSAHEDTQFAVTRFKNGVTFLAAEGSDFDLVFMDIEMPSLNGMETAKRLRKLNPSVVLVFVTNFAQYAVNGYEVGALDFLVKPVTYANFEVKLLRATETVKMRAKDIVVISGSDGVVTVSKSDIKYVEIMSHDMIYHTVGCGDLRAYGTLKKAEEMLGPCFVRCSSAYLVNLAFVKSVRGYTVTVGGDKLPLSRLRKKAFMESLADYYGGKI